MGNLAAIIVAAGSSRRMGFDKLTALLAGEPLICHTLAAFQQCLEVERIVLVVNGERLEEFCALTARFSKVTHVVAGGAERVDSVLAGVKALENFNPTYVAVHDGARPLITPLGIKACFNAAQVEGAAVCAEPVTDTLHRTDSERLAIETVPRTNLWRMQTPQILEATVLRSILEEAAAEGATVTDEISLLVRLGKKARIVEISEWNFKVTYPRDLALAESIILFRPL